MAILPSSNNKRWMEGAIVYQVYPRSFYDTNADGIGDIPGVTAKLDYLSSLGVNAIWLSPFYPSPMADFGYDVADYLGVDPIFGKLADIDELIRKAHRKKIKIMIDLVPNHSSDEHEWFRQSRQSREGIYADWYVWHDPKGFDKDGKPLPPNNWLSIFSGESAWEWEPARQQFYMHTFDVSQPDLNWNNYEVREIFKDIMRAWLNRGVDGFRLDAIQHMGKDPLFKSNPKNPHYRQGYGARYNSLMHINSQRQPHMYTYFNDMADVLKEPKYKKSHRFMVAEWYADDPAKDYLEYYQAVDSSVAAPFIFEGIHMPWQASRWRKFLDEFHRALDALGPLCVPSYAFGNHDQHRLVTRHGEARGRAAAVMLLTLPGMAFIYNGEEIGMKDGHIPKELVQDPHAADGNGRDPERTPMQWTSGRNAGFSTAESTWLPIAAGYETDNVAVQSRDKNSFLSLYRRLGALRNGSAALKHGGLKLIDTGHDDVLGYMRLWGRKKHIVLINFADHPVKIKFPESLKFGKLQVSSVAGSKPKRTAEGFLRLKADEAAVFSGK